MPTGGVAELRELETSERLVVELDVMQAAYNREVEKYLQEMQQISGECAADHVLTPTTLGVEEALLQRVTRLR